MPEPLWHYNHIMNKLSHAQRTQVANCLIEGCSIRATVRMTGVAKKTVMRFLVEIGEVCADYQDFKSIFAGLVCVFVASLLVLEVISTYLSVVYHVGMGPLGWNSSFFTSPLDWLFTAVMFSGGFFWEFRRSRSK